MIGIFTLDLVYNEYGIIMHQIEIIVPDLFIKNITKWWQLFKAK